MPDDAPARRTPGLPAALAAVAGVTLLGGVAAAASFPSAPRDVSCPVAVPSAVAVLAPVVDEASALARMVEPGGTWLAATSPTDYSQTAITGSTVKFAAVQTWFDDQGRHLGVKIISLTAGASDADAKDIVNGRYSKDLLRTDDGIWTSDSTTGNPAVEQAAAAQNGFLVAVFIDGDPQAANPAEVLTIERAQLANMPTAAEVASGAAPVAFRRAAAPSPSATATAPDPRCRPQP